ncbi:MAG: YbhB/YbcL family Raf kinase inhibitor-like protein, partial [Candidatus Curtissbacteria bacterium]|nr:YbhB/YbcL family Raf kinase inhibitor-like protein [Candidatus Curtissbacteria bacterium]
MKITSAAFENNAKIPSKYTCDGENINPPLSFSGVPANAKSLVLIMDDPDAPNGTWVHWMVFNINPKINEISENSLPKDGIEGVTSFGKKGYGGACPPSGTHRYFFKLYALDTILNLTNPNKAALEKEIQDHIIEKAELIGLY